MITAKAGFISDLWLDMWNASIANQLKFNVNHVIRCSAVKLISRSTTEEIMDSALDTNIKSTNAFSNID